MVKYPDTKVRLVGEDGNAFSIMARVTSALKQNGHADAVDAYMKEAMSGDYDNLLQVTMQYVDAS